MAKKYYITTTIPYVNADPHVGFALEIIRADCLARLHRSLGEEVFYNAGSDEHGVKIYRKALESGKTPQAYVDEYAARFGKLKQALNLSYDNFIRTTDPKHEAAAQEFWRICDKAGYIYKKNYKIKYCPGCELEKTDSELIDGRCEFHPTTELDLIDEENYFFKFSHFEKQLLALYTKNPAFVVPEKRQKEIRNFVEEGLEDFSISRIKEKMPWGVPVPSDDAQVMYVWFDALVNYISTLGWPENQANFAQFWGTKDRPQGIQLAGKDNLRQQSCMWQAMLMAADLPLSKQIFIGDFIQSGGQRMSKSTGNVVDPFEYVDKYGTDALRYFLLAKINPFNDSDFTREKFEEAYQADLANGLGNLVARVGTMVAATPLRSDELRRGTVVISPDVVKALEAYKFDEAMTAIWERIKKADQYVSEKKVWALTGDDKTKALVWLVGEIRQIAIDLAPFMPETAEKISQQFATEKIVKGEALFPRLV